MIRTIKTKAQSEARKKRNQLIIGIFISLLMVSSIVGYALLSGYGEENQNQKKQEYNNYVFTKTEEGWQTKVNVAGNEIFLTSFFLPSELENITTEGRPFLSDFQGKTIYIIANNLSERRAASIFASALGKFVLRIQLACSEEEANESFCSENNLPVKSCEDASFTTLVIEIKEGKEETEVKTNVNYKNSCLIIEGNSHDLIRASEKAIFMIFGII